MVALETCRDGGGGWTARSFTHSWAVDRSYPALSKVPQWGWARCSQWMLVWEHSLDCFPATLYFIIPLLCHVLGYHIPRRHSIPHLDCIWSPQGKPKVEDLTKRLIQNTQNNFQETLESSTKIKIASLLSHCLLFVQNMTSGVKGMTYYSGLPIWNNNWCWFPFFFFFLSLKVVDYSPPCWSLNQSGRIPQFCGLPACGGSTGRGWETGLLAVC